MSSTEAESILSVLAELWMHQNGASGEVLIERKESNNAEMVR